MSPSDNYEIRHYKAAMRQFGTRKISTKIRCVWLGVASLLALNGCATPHVNLLLPGKRPPNAHELFYTAVASDFGDAGMCRKISDRAIEEKCGPDFACSKWDVSYEKSECYFHAATRFHMFFLCDRVKGIVTLPRNYSDITESECNRLTKTNQQYGYAPSPDFYLLPDLMQEMSYRDEDRYAARYSEHGANVPVFGFYETIRNTEEFKAKISGLPSYAERFSEDKLRPFNNDEMLFEMAALDDEIPRFCQKVSPNAYYAFSDPNRGKHDFSLRDYCFYDLAVTTGDAQLCENLSSEGPFSTRYAKQDCMTEVRMKGSTRQVKNSGSGAIYFPKMGELVQALQKLGYEKPFKFDENSSDWAPDVNGTNWSEFYQYLLFQGSQDEKEEFMKRAENLPSYAK